MTWSSEISADSPRAWYRLDDVTKSTGTLADSSGNGKTGSYLNGGGISNVAGYTNDANNGSELLRTSSEAAFLAGGNFSDWASWTEGTVEGVVDVNDVGGTDHFVVGMVTADSVSGSLSLWINGTTGYAVAYAQLANGSTLTASGSTALFGGAHHLLASYTESSGELVLYVDGTAVDTQTSVVTPQALKMSGFTGGNGPQFNMLYLGGRRCTAGSGTTQDCLFLDGVLDEVAVYDSPLSGTRAAAHAAEVEVAEPITLPITWEIKDTLDPYLRIIWNIAETVTPSLPITWDIKDTHAPSLPITWEIPETLTPSLPITWSIIDSAHAAATAARWGLVVTVDGTDLSARLTAEATITFSETASALATVSFIPEAGVIDPDDYENKAITIDYRAYSDAGALTYQVRRFTGVTARAEYDPDSGRLRLSATTDLQGALEASTRTAIDTLISSGAWSPFVFDATADGWQYARDRLSTTPGEIHIDAEGKMIFAAWAAGSPAITFTDGERFSNSLRLERATRRDLLNQVAVSVDFRYTRLRQRDLAVRIVYENGPCEFLLNAFDVLQRGQVQTAADGGTHWHRQGEITYLPFFESESRVYLCSNPGGPQFPIVFVGAGVDYSRLCLGADWKASRRWGQTINETAAVTVSASDSIAAVGTFGIAEDYGLEAPFDARAWETEPFQGTRAGAALNTANDWVVEADDVVDQGRTEYEAAQSCAIAKAKTAILERHRRNRVTFRPVYRPDISLSQTLRVNTPFLKATGKVAEYVETFDLAGGGLGLEITLAISRHGGSGIASDDPIAAVPTPTPPTETPGPGTITLPYYIGGDPDSVLPQNPDWQGFITNRQYPADRNTLYEAALAFEYPEIEDTARDVQAVTTTATIDVAIPLDELTLSA